MSRKTTYPVLADVQEAGLMTLGTWEARLPRPETDVQRTILRRIKARRDMLLGQQTRSADPGVAIADLMAKLGMTPPVSRK